MYFHAVQRTAVVCVWIESVIKGFNVDKYSQQRKKHPNIHSKVLSIKPLNTVPNVRSMESCQEQKVVIKGYDLNLNLKLQTSVYFNVKDSLWSFSFKQTKWMFCKFLCEYHQAQMC